MVIGPSPHPGGCVPHLFHGTLSHSLFSSVLPLCQERSGKSKTVWFTERLWLLRWGLMSGNIIFKCVAFVYAVCLTL